MYRFERETTTVRKRRAGTKRQTGDAGVAARCGAVLRDATDERSARLWRPRKRVCRVYYGRMSHCSDDVGGGDGGGGGTHDEARCRRICRPPSSPHSRLTPFFAFLHSGTRVLEPLFRQCRYRPCCATDGERGVRKGREKDRKALLDGKSPSGEINF